MHNDLKHKKNTFKESSNDCVRQVNAFKQNNIQVRAKSVKQVKACTDCQFFKKDASGKRCNLYHLPVVANTEELSQIVNHLTAGVPNPKKRAALVAIANRTDEHVQSFDAAKTAQTNIVKTADAEVGNQAKREQVASRKFYSEHVAKLHDKGVGLKAIYDWADKKFGSVDTSIAFRGFVSSLRKDEGGKIVVANTDLEFLNKIGIRSEAFQGSAKCASCPTHYGRTAKVENERGAMRVDGKFAERTPDVVRTAANKKEAIVVTADTIRKWHTSGHSVEKIYNGVANKVGSVQAQKVVSEFIAGLKRMPSKRAVSEFDRAFLVGKLGMKPEAVRMLDPMRRPTNQVVANVPNDARILAYPGMGKQANEKTATDGHSILNEYDLSRPVESPEIDTNGPDRLDVQTGNSFRLEE